MPARTSGRGGFTLLEVLVALGLFFMSVTFFSMAYLNTLNAMASVRVNQGLEQDLAIIRRQALLLSDVEEVEEGGDVITGQHGTARWRIEYEPTKVADLFFVRLSVELEPEDEEQGVSEAVEEFYLTRPTWSDPVERDELRTQTRERLLDRQRNLNR
ncbi:prepilin-type N-terminal cleavage/methylation domain-containing protein [Pelagicoccus sp. SDUM812003]|uniref:prepilin-type N-terminal cleavage/methylation domain-containing protein n=1 Tax=Pelagicoccus sp. SDUM812003 TaxID=3041267 RepID=UPI0028105284|nr:prepilin-type N-terminal cleavage/methylation domain-containing protein [Pelagicoccus sp. SDUM812003]MDQ8202961.1 prepilin-type N-terminal cleavage/methylation domain-containing protein [Pelagicoccus sp. SDUM812003]